MKMMKSLLLGSAAGLVAVAGAQAADLPVKAKPVEYVKVCSAYGPGFYYIPGTDICLRVGGYVWSEFENNDYGAGPNFASGAIGSAFTRNGVPNAPVASPDWTSFRTRFDLILDARTNTEYGTLRSYVSTGWQWTTGLTGFRDQQLPASAGNYAWYYDRAFIQFAGLTFGYIGSFFDFDPSLVINQQSSKSFKFTPAIAYTAQLGNGISATVSMEDATTRRTSIWTFGALPAVFATSTAGTIFGMANPSTTGVGGETGTALFFPVAAGTSGFAQYWYGGQNSPDFVANLRVDQAWGDAQASVGLHQLHTSTAQPFSTAVGGNPFSFANNGMKFANDKWGYAFLAGVNIKLPMLGAGDSIQFEGAWAKGAENYTGVSANPYSSAYALGYRSPGLVGPVIPLMDSFVDNTGQHLSTAWSLNAELRHFWTPTLRSSIAYGYNKITQPVQSQISFAPTGLTAGAAGDAGFVPDGKINQVTANIIWSPVKNLDLGLEGYWAQLQTDSGGMTAVNCAADLIRCKTKSFEGGLFRATRSF